MDYTELLPPLPESVHLYHDAVAENLSYWTDDE